MGDDVKALPEPATVSELNTDSMNNIAVLMNMDFKAYHRKTI